MTAMTVERGRFGRRVPAGGRVHPDSVDNPLQVDHVVPVTTILFLDSFLLLTHSRQIRVLDHQDNLMLLNRSANATRRDRSWADRAWSHSTVDDQPAIRAELIVRERRLIGELEELIQKEYRAQRAASGVKR